MKIKKLVKSWITVLSNYVEPKTWEASQQYEWNNTVNFMSTSDFKDLARAAISDPSYKVSSGYAPSLVLTEFFQDSKLEWQDFVEYIAGKNCLEIGPCTSTVLASWDTALARYVIEPLADKVSAWQLQNLGFSMYEGVTTFSVGADEYIQSLANVINGAIYCRNCIDHSPNWMFILSNISIYASPGCRLLLWNDIFHPDGTDAGHYNITQDPAAMRRLIDSLGFEIIREYTCVERRELNWGCFAIKR